MGYSLQNTAPKSALPDPVTGTKRYLLGQWAALWLVLRIAVSAFAAWISKLSPFTPLEQALALWPPSMPSGQWLYRVFLAPWERRDVTLYLRIVELGYHTSDGTAQFHPLYPWLALPLARLTDQPLLGLLIVSSLTGLGSAWFLSRLAELEWGYLHARTAVLLYLTCPLAFFLFVPYSEALFLLLSIACFWFLRRRVWWAAGLAGGLAALTRQQGILLLVPAAIELWDAYRHEDPGLLRNWKAWVGLSLIPSGLLLWLIYRAAFLSDLNLDVHNFHELIYSFLISSSAVEVVSTQTFMWPWQALALALMRLWQAPDLDLIVNLVLSLGFLLAVIFSWRRLRLSYRLYVLAMTLISFSYHTGMTHPYMGLPRHLFLAFPVFIGLAPLIRHPWQRLAIVGSGFAGILFLTFLFGLRAWVP
jgi:hypothetical protein